VSNTTRLDGQLVRLAALVLQLDRLKLDISVRLGQSARIQGCVLPRALALLGRCEQELQICLEKPMMWDKALQKAWHRHVPGHLFQLSRGCSR
jgi:hypothetical protein